MTKLGIALNDLGPEGLELTMDDPAIWAEPCGEFRIPIQVIEPLLAKIAILPQEDGCLVRGSIVGRVSLDCDRCADPTLISIEQSFDEFEPYPDENAANNEDEIPETQLIYMGKSGPMLDLGALLWEEFALALPVKPLCSPECKGICPQCGTNRNRSDCDCAAEEGDPRLAALREFSKKRAESGE